MQRYGEDLPQTILTFNAETGLIGCGGSLKDIEINDCGKVILELLGEKEMTETEIKSLGNNHNNGVVSISLRLLVQEGKLNRQGSGKKGDPYKYSVVRQNARDSRSNYIYMNTHNTQNIISAKSGDNGNNHGNQ